MINQAEYKLRRQKLMQQIGNGGIAIIPAAPQYLRNGDAHFQYRQDSNFYYLTGFLEPDAVVILIPGRTNGEYLLFNQTRDPQLEIWVGARAGQEGARQNYGVDEAYPIEMLDEIIAGLLADKESVYYAFGHYPNFDNKIITWVNQLRHKVRSGIVAPTKLVNIEEYLNEMRLIKSPAEIAVMRHVAQLSAAAHLKAMQACKHHQYEYEIEAVILQHLMHNGCHATAYSSIVGGGANGCTLHYVENNCRLNPGELLLIDAGGEYQCYAADITRTFPINGKFSPEQRSIYSLVLQAQQAAIDIIKPGVPWYELQATIIKIITQGLCELGILQGAVDELIAQKAYHHFYMHNSGHWLGLDVHDVGSYKVAGKWRTLQPNMVLTVEPGIYIPANSANVDPKWWNIGIRIEDDVLVTATGYEVLSAAAPKEIAEIERIMG